MDSSHEGNITNSSNLIQEIPIGSLQESFLKFRQQKIKERQLVTNSKSGSIARNPNEKQQLRQKFVDRAKNYIGVPYALRYKSDEDPIAPLYLDCCGLVRKVVQDLQDDFGFIIGKWNQAYQMDTLPISIAQEELKFGDLIFYEGTFVSPRSKVQKHNIVHVEIFLGGETGEESIGSRFHQGKVSIFPSFKFESTTWKLVQYHFRSIDTWLDGICRSFCSEHPWSMDSVLMSAAVGKKSIFNPESDDESAGDFDEAFDSNDLDHTMDQKSIQEFHEKNIEDDNIIPVTKVNSVVTGVPKNKRILGQHSKDETAKNHHKSEFVSRRVETSRSLSSVEKLIGNSNNMPFTYYVSKSNGWRLVKAALDKRGWQQLPFEYQFSSRFSLKWVERRSQIDYRSHTVGQLVCHIPNNDIISTKVGLLSTLREFYSVSFDGKSSSGRLLWLPETYDLSIPADHSALLLSNDTATKEKRDNFKQKDASTESADTRTPEDAIWIYKPASNNRGRGIRILHGISDLNHVCNINSDPIKGIVQRYIENPLLVGPQRLKFDVRCYLLIARNFPTTLAFYHPGYCRLTMKSYSLTMDSLSDNSAHLTNASVQKKDPTYQNNKELQIQSVESISERIASSGNHSSATYLREHLNHDIMRCMVDVLKACNSKLARKHGYFDLLGCDFMLSDKNELFLLEINTNPALSLDNSTLEALLPMVVDGALELVIGAQGPGRSDVKAGASYEEGDSLMLASVPQNFKLIYNEGTGFTYQ
eukprot:gene12981-17406_t